MKIFITIAVLALIIGGFFLLRNSDTLEYASTPREDTPAHTVPEGWVQSVPNAQGIQFAYPKELGTRYIHAQEWPPVVERITGTVACEEKEAEDENGTHKRFERTEIQGQPYCIARSDEGAAGSTYTTYEYTTQQGDSLVRITFTLRSVQCLNYEGEEQTMCQNEQASFDLNTLVKSMADSLRML